VFLGGVGACRSWRWRSFFWGCYPAACTADASPGEGSVRPSSHRAPGLRCSQFAHRRCAYSWTSQHTFVVSMQVRCTMVDTSVRRGTGWPGSNPGTLSALTPRANHRIDRFASGPSLAIRRPPDRPRRCRSHSARCRRPGTAPPQPWWRPAQPGCRPVRCQSATRCWPDRPARRR
jgi:hypothetical protein